MDRAPKQLRGWKDIASYLGASERSVMRWEANRGLPVHRVTGAARDAVFASTDELEAWLKGQDVGWAFESESSPSDDRPTVAAGQPRPSSTSERRRPRVVVAVVASLAVLVGLILIITTWRSSPTKVGGSGDVSPGAAGAVAPAASPHEPDAGVGLGREPPITLELSVPGRTSVRLGVAPGKCGWIDLTAGKRIQICARPIGERLAVDVLLLPESDSTMRTTQQQAPRTYGLERNSRIRILEPMVFDVEWVTVDSAPPAMRTPNYL